MRKPGYLKYKQALPGHDEDEATRIKAVEASTGKPYSEWLKTQNKENKEKENETSAAKL